jgi:hypothetical protein
MKILQKISMPKWAEKTFSNQQLGMKVYMKLIMIMELE